MRPRSAAAEAIIRAFRFINPGVTKTAANVKLAEAWVQAALAAGCHPHVRQEPLTTYSSAGEWVLAVSRAGLKHPLYPGRLPQCLLDEVFFILARLGRVLHDGSLKVWHGNVWPDDSSPSAVALRMMLVRQSLAMDRGRFYGACGFNPKAGEALEAGHACFASLDHEMLDELSACYGIPQDWLTFGNADEIQARMDCWK